MTLVVPKPKVASRASRPRRWWFPLSVIGLALVAMVGLSQVSRFAPDALDRGMRFTYSFICAVVALIAAVAWFFFAAGLTRGARLVGAAALAACVVLVLLAVRHVEFSGDMVPTFDFRWSPDRLAVLQAHRARQQAAPQGDVDQATPAATKAGAAAMSPFDVLEYRGAHRDGVAEGPPLARDWAAHPPKLVWRQPVGGGYASFVVVGPLAITTEQRGDHEAVVAYDVDTGRERWVHDYPAHFSETLGGDGPRATPTVHQEKLYSLGATGVLSCLELAGGRPLWSLNILERNGAANLDWGMAGSPLVYDNRVLVNPGSQKGSAAARAIIAFDAADGEPLWAAGNAKASYSSPMLVTLAGLRQVIIFDAVGLAGHDAADGRELWRTPWKSDFDINAAQPVILTDDRLLISSASGAAVIKIAQTDGKWSAGEVWKNRKLKSGYASPIVYQGHVYGIDESILACLDVASGKQIWKDRAAQYGHGQMLLRGDLLVVLAETGELALVEAMPDGFHELGRMQAIEGKTWNNPTIVGQRIFVRNHIEMAAYDLPTEP
jgi:outer membrane protein assembly factor BamB